MEHDPCGEDPHIQVYTISVQLNTEVRSYLEAVQARVVALHQRRGQSLDEISQALHLSKTTVHRRAHTAWTYTPRTPELQSIASAIEVATWGSASAMAAAYLELTEDPLSCPRCGSELSSAPACSVCAFPILAA